MLEQVPFVCGYGVDVGLLIDLSDRFGMAGISQDVGPADILPMLARNVSLWGYENQKPTEFLLLIDRYVHLARELRALTGPDGTIRVAGCGSWARRGRAKA